MKDQEIRKALRTVWIHFPLDRPGRAGKWVRRKWGWEALHSSPPLYAINVIIKSII